MKLIEAPGSLDMQRASSDPNVRKIVDILLQVKGTYFFKLIALFIRNTEGSAPSSSIANKLQVLRITSTRRVDANGLFNISSHIDEIISALEDLYKQGNPQTINFQRGAVVEILAMKLVDSRCRSNECFNNVSFSERRYSSDQLDVAILSEWRREVEAYTCKIKCGSIMSYDCTNLTALATQVQALGYDVHVGAICFDDSELITQRISDRLKDITSYVPIHAYGLNNILELERSPF